jgi:class 3 adenylate cyclase
MSDELQMRSIAEAGVLLVDVSGYSQLVYQCMDDEPRLRRLALAMQRLFAAADGHDDLRVEGYAGDGFLAICTAKRPAAATWQFAEALQQRFDQQTKSLLMNLGFRVDVQLRCGLHVGRVWQVAMPEPAGHDRSLNISDAIVVASRLVCSQTARRTGMAISRACFKRLLLAGGRDVRDPDEVIQDRNQYPEPIEVYRLRDAERQQVAGRGG